MEKETFQPQVYTIVHDGQNLLIAQRSILRTFHNSPYKAPFPSKSPGQWTLPGGKASKSATSLHDACLKEFRNETGVDLGTLGEQKLLDFGPYAILYVKVETDVLVAICMQVKKNFRALAIQIYDYWKDHTKSKVFHKLFGSLSPVEGATPPQDDELMDCAVVSLVEAREKFNTLQDISQDMENLWYGAIKESGEWQMREEGEYISRHQISLWKLGQEKRQPDRGWFLDGLKQFP